MSEHKPLPQSSNEHHSDNVTMDAPPQSRQGFSAEWKWKGTVFICFLTSAISGYDVSNVANIQPRLYEAFGGIEVLPWIGLSYSLANFAMLSFARKIIFCVDMRWVYLLSMIIFMVGAVVSGAADNMTAVIVGRIIMGVGGAMVQQLNVSYLAVFSTTAESAGLFAAMSASWAVGLVVGGPIGSAFAENTNATWRWAFYLNLPLVGLAFIVAALCIPSHCLGPADVPLGKRLLSIDPLGIFFNIAAPVLFAIVVTFTGPIWDWDSGASIAMWVISILVVLAWAAQQVFCIFTTPEERAFPVHLLKRFDLMPIWIASGCAGAAYAVTLYYLPLFFAFARGYGALDQTIRVLPFILVFIVAVLLTGALLPIIGRYKIIYVLAGIFTLSGAAALAATLSSDTSESQVMGLEAVLAIGLSLHFQHGLGISNVINKHNERDRVDSSVLCNMAQMGSIAMILAVAGSIFQNVGFTLLSDAIADVGLQGEYWESDIREALAGVASSVWQSGDPELQARGLAAVTDLIAREFWIVTAAGALCLICGAWMKWEKLDYERKKPVKKSKEAPGDSPQQSIAPENESA